MFDMRQLVGKIYFICYVKLRADKLKRLLQSRTGLGGV